MPQTISRRLFALVAYAYALAPFHAAVASADELTIFDMRKSLAMSADEKSYRDFYVNRGAEAGLKVGMIINVTRQLPMYDSFQNRSAGELRVVVGKVKIIHAQQGLAVARLHQELIREDIPLLEDPFVMLGDHLDLGSATMEKKTGKSASASAMAEPQPMGQPEAQAGQPSNGPATHLPTGPIQHPENSPDTASAREFAVDFASKAPDNSASKATVNVPVMQ